MTQGVALPWIITIILASCFLGLIVGLVVFHVCKKKEMMEEAIVFDQSGNPHRVPTYHLQNTSMAPVQFHP